MKFTDKDLEIYSLIKAEELESCHICKESTQYIDYNYEVRCCSNECLDKLDNQYEEDYKRMDNNEYCDLDTEECLNKYKINKVYAVWIYNDEDSDILDVFSTKEKADIYMKENWYDRPKKDSWSPTFGIEEYEVN